MSTGTASAHRFARGSRPCASTRRCSARPPSLRARERRARRADASTTRAPRRSASSVADSVSSVPPEQDTATTRSIGPTQPGSGGPGAPPRAPGRSGPATAVATSAAIPEPPIPVTTTRARPVAGQSPASVSALDQDQRLPHLGAGRGDGQQHPVAVEVGQRSEVVEGGVVRLPGRSRPSGLVDQQHRDVVADRVGQPAGGDVQTSSSPRSPPSSARSGEWQLRAGQDLQQPGVELHGSGLLLVGRARSDHA